MPTERRFLTFLGAIATTDDGPLMPTPLTSLVHSKTREAHQAIYAVEASLTTLRSEDTRHDAAQAPVIVRFMAVGAIDVRQLVVVIPRVNAVRVIA